jgi:hypothetical protein
VSQAAYFPMHVADRLKTLSGRLFVSLLVSVQPTPRAQETCLAPMPSRWRAAILDAEARR